MNYKIAPVSGRYKPDVILNFANLYEELGSVDILPKDFVDELSILRSKGQYRPASTKNAREFFELNDCASDIPKIYKIIEELGIADRWAK